MTLKEAIVLLKDRYDVNDVIDNLGITLDDLLDNTLTDILKEKWDDVLFMVEI